MKFVYNLKYVLMLVLTLGILSTNAYCGPFDCVNPYDTSIFTAVALFVVGIVVLVIGLLVYWIHAIVKGKPLKATIWFSFKLSAVYSIVFGLICLWVYDSGAKIADKPRVDAIRSIKNVCFDNNLKDYAIDDHGFYCFEDPYYQTVVFYYRDIDSKSLAKIKKIENVQTVLMINENEK